jgi:hypothetical protein
MVGRRGVVFLHVGSRGLEVVIGGTLSSVITLFVRAVAFREVVYHTVVPGA